MLWIWGGVGWGGVVVEIVGGGGGGGGGGKWGWGRGLLTGYKSAFLGGGGRVRRFEGGKGAAYRRAGAPGLRLGRDQHKSSQKFNA